MKMTQSAKLITGLGLMAGLFWGCQDLLSQKDGSAKDPEAIATDESSLRLSIKDDSACREQWNVILDARAGGLADTAAEKSFLANCVTEIKPGKDKLPPAHSAPSATRFHQPLPLDCVPDRRRTRRDDGLLQALLPGRLPQARENGQLSA